jgi:hypothetical protein
MDMLKDAASRVARGDMYKIRFSELQQTCGFNYNPHGIGADLTLRPHVNVIGTHTWDWVHNLFQDGVLSTEVELLIVHCGDIGVTRSGDLPHHPYPHPLAFPDPPLHHAIRQLPYRRVWIGWGFV